VLALHPAAGAGEGASRGFAGLLRELLCGCAECSGAGRSLELMAEVLGVDITELGPVSLESTRPVVITNQCSIFAEMEILHYRCEERGVADIAAGINESMARRVKMLAGKVGIKEDIGMTGGVSKNVGVVKHLEKMLGKSFHAFPEDPQIIGALGAAIFAAEKAKAANRR